MVFSTLTLIFSPPDIHTLYLHFPLSHPLVRSIDYRRICSFCVPQFCHLSPHFISFRRPLLPLNDLPGGVAKRQYHTSAVRERSRGSAARYEK